MSIWVKQIVFLQSVEMTAMVESLQAARISYSLTVMLN